MRSWASHFPVLPLRPLPETPREGGAEPSSSRSAGLWGSDSTLRIRPQVDVEPTPAPRCATLSRLRFHHPPISQVGAELSTPDVSTSC